MPNLNSPEVTKAIDDLSNIKTAMVLDRFVKVAQLVVLDSTPDSEKLAAEHLNAVRNTRLPGACVAASLLGKTASGEVTLEDASRIAELREKTASVGERLSSGVWNAGVGVDNLIAKIKGMAGNANDKIVGLEDKVLGAHLQSGFQGADPKRTAMLAALLAGGAGAGAAAGGMALADRKKKKK